MSEQEILDGIAVVENMQKGYRAKIYQARMTVIENESNLITVNLKLEKLKEELRVSRLRNPIQEETQREADIREFRVRHPEVLKKIK